MSTPKYIRRRSPIGVMTLQLGGVILTFENDGPSQQCDIASIPEENRPAVLDAASQFPDDLLIIDDTGDLLSPTPSNEVTDDRPAPGRASKPRRR